MLVFVELVADLLAGCALPFRAKSTELNSVRAAAQDQLEPPGPVSLASKISSAARTPSSRTTPP